MVEYTKRFDHNGHINHFKDAKKKVEDMSFEEAFAKLNKILEEFENGEVSLETSISLYEEGMLLKNHCDKKLQNAEMKIKKVVGKKSEDVE